MSQVFHSISPVYKFLAFLGIFPFKLTENGIQLRFFNLFRSVFVILMINFSLIQQLMARDSFHYVGSKMSEILRNVNLVVFIVYINLFVILNFINREKFGMILKTISHVDVKVRSFSFKNIQFKSI